MIGKQGRPLATGGNNGKQGRRRPLALAPPSSQHPPPAGTTITGNDGGCLARAGGDTADHCYRLAPKHAPLVAAARGAPPAGRPAAGRPPGGRWRARAAAVAERRAAVRAAGRSRGSRPTGTRAAAGPAPARHGQPHGRAPTDAPGPPVSQWSRSLGHPSRTDTPQRGHVPALATGGHRPRAGWRSPPHCGSTSDALRLCGGCVGGRGGRYARDGRGGRMVWVGDERCRERQGVL